MNNIYVVIISTNTKIGTLIKKVTRYQYNHVAISLDANLDKMYSFARYCEASALVGGFVNERGSRYTTPTPIKVFKVELTKENHQLIVDEIKAMQEMADKYIYNTYSALAYPLKKSVKIKNSYTCLEFVQGILEKAINQKFSSIEEIDQRLNNDLVFEGLINDYVEKEEHDSKYFEKISKIKIMGETTAHFFKLSKRLFQK